MMIVKDRNGFLLGKEAVFFDFSHIHFGVAEMCGVND